MHKVKVSTKCKDAPGRCIFFNIIAEGMNTCQARNFVEPSQALRKPRLALRRREPVFLGRLRAELTTARSSPGLLLQCSPKFVLPPPLPNPVYAYQCNCVNAVDTITILKKLCHPSDTIFIFLSFR